jgi:glycosyltransferase involved in cell wall biosynthesis
MWFDVDDLIQYFGYAQRPTGIQRVGLALYREFDRHHAQKIGFCRRCGVEAGFRQVDFAALEGVLRGMIAGQIAPAAPAPPAAPAKISPLRAALRRLPPKFRRPLGRLAGAGLQSAAAIRELLAASAPKTLGPQVPPPMLSPSQFDLAPVKFQPGDWLVNLGNSWNKPYRPAVLAALRAGGVGFALLIHDVIPELFPEWSAPETMREFRAWLRDTVPLADMVFAVSQNSAADLLRFIQAMQVPAPPVRVLKLGSAALAAPAAPAAPTRPYVLMVGTIEVRKNHFLMFRVWQTLLQTMPPGRVPDLVFAGKPGWLTADFLQQMENTAWLNGRIKFVNSPPDAALAALYQGCVFTVFPSLYEGWGLPVTESLSFGKTVAASNRASIPEAGGAFCSYFDPENLMEAAAVIRGLIERPERVAEFEARIAKYFAPPSWAESAAALLEALAPAPAEHAAVMEQAA